MESQTTSHLCSKSSNFLEQKPKSLHDLTSSWIRSSPQTLLTSFLYFSPVLTLLRPHWLCSSLIYRESSCFRAFVDPSAWNVLPHPLPPSNQGSPAPRPTLTLLCKAANCLPVSCHYCSPMSTSSFLFPTSLGIFDHAI